MAQRFEVITSDSTPPVWAALRQEAEHVAATEPSLASLVNATILAHADLTSALSYQLARKLGDQELRAMSLREVCEEAYAAQPSLIDASQADLRAVFEEIVEKAMAILSAALRERLPGIADEIDDSFSDRLHTLLAAFAPLFPTVGN